ncbi:prolactin-1-like [Kryptolebias marmoratus]|uniref:prolactin-1-like n=1 Tax=Kryptolebias marmoratus TaxID=37003 RepID=UPI0018ACCF45|nr:prolactin-1-like [Kryptolebias marmoratus]
MQTKIEQGKRKGEEAKQKEAKTDPRLRKETEMAQRRTSGGKLFMAVVYMLATCRAVPINDLLNRASQHSDEMYSLASHIFPMSLERLALCHTSVLPTPNNKEQILQFSVSWSALCLLCLASF